MDSYACPPGDQHPFSGERFEQLPRLNATASTECSWLIQPCKALTISDTPPVGHPIRIGFHPAGRNPI